MITRSEEQKKHDMRQNVQNCMKRIPVRMIPRDSGYITMMPRRQTVSVIQIITNN